MRRRTERLLPRIHRSRCIGKKPRIPRSAKIDAQVGLGFTVSCFVDSKPNIRCSRCRCRSTTLPHMEIPSRSMGGQDIKVHDFRIRLHRWLRLANGRLWTLAPMTEKTSSGMKSGGYLNRSVFLPGSRLIFASIIPVQLSETHLTLKHLLEERFDPPIRWQKPSYTPFCFR